MTRTVSRRDFLKLSAAGLAGWGLGPRWAGALGAPTTPHIAAAVPLPYPHRYLRKPEALLARLPDADLLVVPAYLAAGLIGQGAALPLQGPAGRAHDPEGAYTVPYGYAVSALVQPAGTAPVNPWQGGPAWPVWGRLVLGAALQRQGYSPNEAHAGRVAQAGQDLLALRPRLAADPLEAVRMGHAPAAVALVPLSADGALDLPAGLAAMRLPWGGVLVEYDWLVPANAADPEAARTFVAGLGPAAPPSLPEAWRLPPLAPLPARTQAQHARLWADLTRARRETGA